MLKFSREVQDLRHNKGNNTHLSENFLSKNPLLILGVAVSPVIFYANSFENAVILSAFMSVHVFLTLMISSFIPKKIVYISRVLLYTVISALVFTAVRFLAESYFPKIMSDFGVCAWILITSPFIISLSETRFFKESKLRMTGDIILSLAGYSIAAIIIGTLRELISQGGINGNLYGISFTIPSLDTIFGGFIVTGLLAALARSISGVYLRKKDK